MSKQKWEAIRFSFSGAVGAMNWSAGIKILAYHQKPDAVSPTGAPLFIDRHINPKTRPFAAPRVTRNSQGMDEAPDGAHVSLASCPGGELYDAKDGLTAHQRDWEFLVKERDRVLAEKGLLKSKDTLKKLKALADYIQSRRGGEERYPSRHPVDFLLHSSYCTGAANTLVGLATTMGLRGRVCGCVVHAMAEVEVDGRWHFFDNTKLSPVTLIPDRSFMEVSARPEKVSELNNPRDPQGLKKRDFYAALGLHGDDFNYSGGAFLLGSTSWHFNQGGVGRYGPSTSQTLLNGAGVAVGLDGTTARGLYPHEKEIVCRATDTGALMLANKYCWWRSGMKLQQGQSVRRQFYLGETGGSNPLRHVDVQVLLMPKKGKASTFNAEGWTLGINGRDYPLTAGGVEWSHEYRQVPAPLGARLGFLTLPEELIRFRLPASLLKANSMNVVSFGSGTPGKETVNMLMFPDPVLPHLPAFSRGVKGSLQRDWLIEPDHVCEVTRVHGFEFAAKKPTVIRM
jgi:hypothetical protein